MKDLLHPKVHGMVLIISVIAELIGVRRIDVGIGTIVLLPLLYAFVLGMLVNPHITPIAAKFLRAESVRKTSPLILIAILPFMAKFGTLIGPSMGKIVAVGPALILQEFGNLATMLVALPMAVILFRMGREAIGATFSIAREPNIAIISDKYGLNSDEGVGVLGVYAVGTLFGTIVFSIIAGFLGSLGILSSRALAMACGVGSGSMSVACAGALAEVVPESRDEILAFAGASNILTNATGLYMGLFVALPISERFFNLLSRKRNEAR